MPRKKRHIDIITMGCSKNLVDSERLLKKCADRGFIVHHDPEETHGDIAVVNTCGFILDAKDESIRMILSLCEQKEQGELKGVYVMGCLSERYREELEKEIPEVDRYYGKFNWDQLLSDLQAEEAATNPAAGCDSGRILTTPPHYAYIKISEGCDRTCAYCAIPLITGKHVSRPIEDLLAEVEALTREGVREFQIIAQELTYYGVDLYGEQRLPELIDRMAGIPGVEWIRLHYAYPTHFPEALLDVMAKHPNVCRYLDIALQHISDNVLRRMRRNTTHAETVRLIQRIREKVPGICLRTTLMVGFPGETEGDFAQLMDFVRSARFDRMGAFAYSEEEGTYAAEHYVDDVPEAIKQERIDAIMAVQEGIIAENAAKKVGQTFKVIIDRTEGDYYIGRTEFDSPEVDCEVLIPIDEDLQVGSFYNVKINNSDDFDLYGDVVKS